MTSPVLSRPQASAPLAAPDWPNAARARFSAMVAVTAAAIGLLADLLLRHGPPGAGFSLLVVVFVVAVELLIRARGSVATPAQRFLLLAILFFGVCLSWRAAESLALIDLFAIFVALAALSPAVLGGAAWDAAAVTLVQLMGSGFTICRNALTGSIGFLEDGAVPGLWQGSRGRRARAVLTGVVLALPVIAAFTALLMLADPLFERMVRRVVDVDLDVVAGHVLFAGAFAWLSGGYLRGALFDDRRAGTRATAITLSLGVTELAIVLGAVNALFLSFVLVQLRYLFGGVSHVMATSNLTLADYARRGFHELVFVALLVLPLLLATHELLERESARALRLYRVLAGTLVGLLFLIMFSAAERLRLYMREFGLTEDRVVALAILVWLASVFALFTVTVLRGRPRWFGAGAVVAGWVIAGALNLANPAAVIARVNMERLAEGHAFDAMYLGRLGEDVVPVVLSAFTALPEEHRCTLAVTFLRIDSPGASTDWRSWNLSRERARRLLAANRPRLEATRCVKDGTVTDAAHFDLVESGRRSPTQRR